MKSPSRTHIRIMRAIAKIEKNGDIPFVSDVIHVLGYASEGGVTPTLKTMSRDGLVVIKGGRKQGRPRSLSTTLRAKRLLGVGVLPQWGSIAAGLPEETGGEVQQDWETSDLLEVRPGDFFLKVTGDSMIGDGIHNGDQVLLRPRLTPRVGEIAAVEVGETAEATLKHFFPTKSYGAVLRASNPAFPDIEVHDQQIRIAGVYRGLVRRVR